MASRNRLTSCVNDFKGEVVRLEGDKLDLTNLKQSLESQSLFGQDRLVIIENLFKRRPSKDKESLINYLKKEQPKNLILWEAAKIDGRSLTSFAKAKIEKLEIGKMLFRFMDNLCPNSQKAIICLFHQALEQSEPELVLFMLERQLRQMIIAHDLGEKGLTELPSWKKAILVRQARKFKLNQLIRLYLKLLNIEYNQKTGKTPLSLTSQLDLWLASF